VGRFLLICLGGAIGTGARYLTGVATTHWLGTDFPYGTLVVNLGGGFLVGLVQQLALEAGVISNDVRLILVTGILGGFTTYSSFSYETVHLMQVGAWSRAWINILVSTSFALALCSLGIAAGRWLMLIRG
jgi:CrcB protein